MDSRYPNVDDRIDDVDRLLHPASGTRPARGRLRHGRRSMPPRDGRRRTSRDGAGCCRPRRGALPWWRGECPCRWSALHRTRAGRQVDDLRRHDAPRHRRSAELPKRQPSRKRWSRRKNRENSRCAPEPMRLRVRALLRQRYTLGVSPGIRLYRNGSSSDPNWS